MWSALSPKDREEYKRIILAFASLTKMFAQKESIDSEDIPNPIINSKYQETVFQKVFHATPEDIGNTSYDASLCYSNPDGTEVKYLIGIKTFGAGTKEQKVAQFKANHNEWSDLINKIKQNSIDEHGAPHEKKTIDQRNHHLYQELAKRIALIRNKRIDSSISNLHGFSISEDKDNVQAVYHVLMPSKEQDRPVIYVGETSYDKIDTNNIRIIGCSGNKNPTNFAFTDGKHDYRFTSADSQLYMRFNNEQIIEETWDVIYADDAYAIFSNIADQVYKEESAGNKPLESYSWLITNEKKDTNGNTYDEVELFSGFNAFFGVGSKIQKPDRVKRVNKLRDKYVGVIPDDVLNRVTKGTMDFLVTPSPKAADKLEKVELRDTIVKEVNRLGDPDFKEDVLKLLFRPAEEMYIPLPNSAQFHAAHPDFFAPGVGHLKTEDGKLKLALPKEKCKFTLVFEPSGTEMEAYITEDAGKAIESYSKQTIMGEWLLRKVFQLNEYEPLTFERLKEVGINGLRLSKNPETGAVHLQFIWIDKNNPPEDYIK